MVATDQLGDATIRLVNDDCMLRMLFGLRAGPVSAARLERGIPGATRETVLRRLRTLRRAGFVVPCDESGGLIPRGPRVPSYAYYVLTSVGRVLLDVPAEAIWWETHRSGSVEAMPRGPLMIPGMWALGLISDRTNRVIVRELADRPLRTADLVARIPEVHRSTVYERLAHLTERRLIVRAETDRHVTYALTDAIRELARVSPRAARCEWLRATDSDRARVSDLPGLLHVVAPLARIRTRLAGIYLLDIESDTTVQRRIYLTAASGRISALPTAPTGGPLAIGRGDPATCCEALLRGDPSRLACEGDLVLAQAIFQGLGRVLRRP